MLYPRIYLAIDNCFASKRWTTPEQWMQVINDLGLRYVEASADNECDPLYMGESYINDWIKAVQTAEQQTGVKVANLYSGHGTYATLGLGHTDPRVRDRILRQWLMPMCKTAARLDAGLGFYCHAFNHSILQKPSAYKKHCQLLYDQLAELAACEPVAKSIGVEQMYSPHQIPWTIEGTKQLLQEVYRRNKSPMYITVDTGHHTGQRKFTKPTRQQITNALEHARTSNPHPPLWFGSDEAYQQFDHYTKCNKSLQQAVADIEKTMARFPYLFALEKDGDPYRWLSELACYSPIIHLQQTDGRHSSHWAFTEELNSQGVIEGEKVMLAIFNSFQRDRDQSLPPVVEEIYLTLEIFSATADKTVDIISRLQKSVAYWRRFIPEDGLFLDEIIQRLQ